MPLTLAFSAKAKRDLSDIYAYLERRNAAAAKAVIRAIEKSCLLLAASPQSARRTSYEGVRVKPVPRYPYLIFYRAEGSNLFIVHVRHSARKSATQDELS
jgi:toxin ParE1/3/4